MGIFTFFRLADLPPSFGWAFTLIFLLEELRRHHRGSDPSVTGFNVGVNCGPTAGQTVGHCHVHLIPRRAGDVANPAGGVRHTIPGKGHYPGAPPPASDPELPAG